MTRILVFLLALAFLPAAAQAETPVLYSREKLTIHRQPGEPLPWLEQSTAQEQSGITFDIEARDAMTYYRQKDWFNLISPTDDSGVLLLFSAPGLPPIIPSTHYAALDILFIDAEGRITQLLPNIKLSGLKQPITPKDPVLAFLFLRGGLCQQLNIRPGDSVEYRAFSSPDSGMVSGPVEPVEQQPVIILQDSPRRKPLLQEKPAQEKTAPVKTEAVKERVVK
ncbi:MAG: DUF192 domain-containing protein [Proteobacteria bacterium]|nr:DUF192 domain-containing protein [Pseudomonadota bacterium]